MNHWAFIILKIVSFQELSLRTPSADGAANGWTQAALREKLWWKTLFKIMAGRINVSIWNVRIINMYTEAPKNPLSNFKLFKKAKIWRLIGQIWLMIFQISAALSVSYSSIWKSWNCQYSWLWFKIFWCAIHTPVLYTYTVEISSVDVISKNLPHLRFHIYLTKILQFLSLLRSRKFCEIFFFIN